MKSCKDSLFLGTLPGVELEMADWTREASRHALVVNLVPEDEIAEKSPDYLRTKAKAEFPLVQEAPLPPLGPNKERSLRRFWEKAFIVNGCLASGETALVFDYGSGERTAMFAIAVMMQHGLTFERAVTEALRIDMTVSDSDHIDILKQQTGLPKALRVDL